MTYDLMGRLVTVSYPDGTAPDGTETAFTYTATGQRATVTDLRGTTAYSYDAGDRLTEKIDPTGYRLSYIYDGAGSRTSLTATVGAQSYTTTYTYNALNRLETVTDSQGGVTTLGYDANGNLASLAYPNSITTAYTGIAEPLLTLLGGLSGAPPPGTPAVPLTAGLPRAIPIPQPLPPVLDGEE
jgi:YD repeat-containing protein